jgi:hypothetical protein
MNKDDQIELLKRENEELKKRELEYNKKLEENVEEIDKMLKELKLKYEDIELKTDVKIMYKNVNTIELIIDFEIDIY